MEYIASIITAIGVIIMAWFKRDQKRYDQMTELKIEKWKAEEEQKSTRRSDNIAKIYGVMWQLLHELVADRVYILQPHPLNDSQFVSISLEVKRNGIAPMKTCIQNMPMADIAAFVADLANRDLMFYKSVPDEVKDKRARALMMTNGGVSAIVKRLSDDEHDWIGSLFLEFTHTMDCEPAFTRKALSDAANGIQFILPEIKCKRQ